ncbi:MAG TPA: AIR synthase-related protein, partial [Candidatus Omnitrophota bacterium]|nr:AIR synthase-related protein [Candidatus Omnitrophota bacterium]
AFFEKLPRIVPDGKTLVIEKGSWAVPEIFRKIQKKGRIDEVEMFRTFNMGLGMVVVMPPQDFCKAKRIFALHGIDSWIVGSVNKGSKAKVKIICGF